MALKLDERRVGRELENCKDFEGDGVAVEGPLDTPYQNGIFKLEIILPDAYPFYPPKIKFLSKIYHPNISSQTGAICLDILKDAWSPVYTLKTTLISIQSLLGDPVPDDPQDAEVANVYKNNQALFIETAKQWTKLYADADKKDELSIENLKIKNIGSMGFGVNLVKRALEICDWDENRAIEAILQGNVY
ncbi:hypothetical protein HDU92_009065 [Lobulomyces angularis]|nr:hypothetical protein HDU92_009065 [Lobulomyces angularis]